MPTSSPLPSSTAQVNGDGSITVPMYLNDPTRVTRQIVPVAAANYWADRVLPNGGSVSGGGVVYDLADQNDRFSGREIEVGVAPGSEFPIINGNDPIARTAKVAKYGGKIKVTDEKRDRNDVRYIQRETVRAGNTMVRALHAAAVASINAAVTEFSRTAPVTLAWSSVNITGTSPTPYAQRPAADIQAAQAAQNATFGGEHEVNYDLLLLHPLDYAIAQSIYPASEGGVVRGMFPDGGGDVVVSNLITKGQPLLIEEGAAGQTRWEKPVGTESWREEAIESSWLQISCRSLYFVDNPYAILRLTGASA